MIRKDEDINNSIEKRIKAREKGEEFRDELYIPDYSLNVPE